MIFASSSSILYFSPLNHWRDCLASDNLPQVENYHEEETNITKEYLEWSTKTEILEWRRGGWSLRLGRYKRTQPAPSRRQLYPQWRSAPFQPYRKHWVLHQMLFSTEELKSQSHRLLLGEILDPEPDHPELCQSREDTKGRGHLLSLNPDCRML